MPTVARIGPYRFFFFSNEGNEPIHIHVQRENKLAKFWLAPVRPAGCAGFSSREMRRIERLVIENRAAFVEAWSEYFG